MSDQQEEAKNPHSGNTSTIKIYPSGPVGAAVETNPIYANLASPIMGVSLPIVSSFQKNTLPWRIQAPNTITDSDLYNLFRAAEEKEAHIQRKKEQARLKKEKRQKNAHKKNKRK